MINKPWQVYCFFFFIILGFLFFPKSVRASVLFEDNFDDGNLDGWVVARNMQWNNPTQPCLLEGQPTNWVVTNGKIGIHIRGSSCITEIMPSNPIWNSSWNDYIFETDIIFVRGTDSNIAFRYSGAPNYDWYGYHFQISSLPQQSKVILQRVFNSDLYTNYTYYPFIRETIYHLKIIVDHEHITLYADGNLVLDYPDAGGRFTTGRIALQASVGADPESEVYFDNVKVTSIDEPSPSPSPIPPSPSPTPNPVVILPGMGGSWNTGDLITGNNIGTWKKTPFIKVYDNLKNTFLNAGYVESEDYFQFYYDWRKRLDNLADDLNNYLEAVLNDQPAGTKVDLVGHSMGGLVARTYTQKYGTAKVDDLVTTGSPHEGSVPAYLAWAGAETDKTWESLPLEFYLHHFQGRFTSPVTAIQTLSPSLKDLLPIFDFAKNADGSVIPVGAMTTINDYLVDLKTNLTPALTDLLSTIAGTNQQTTEWIKLGERSLTDRLLDRWPDGKPVTFENTQAGDSTVLNKSALIENTNQQTLVSTHVDLVQTEAGIEAILAALDLDIPAQTGNEQPALNPALFFLLHSPAEITVTDPNGGQAGFGVSNPIPNSFYSPEDKLLLIYGASAGDYQTEVIGTDNGSYQLDIGQLTDNGGYWSSLVDEIQTGSTDDWTVNFQPDEPLADPVVDISGESKIAQAKLRLERLKIYTTDRRLLKYLDQIIKLLDKDRFHLTRLALSSTYKFRFWVDRFAQSDPYLKSEADQIGQLLNQAVVAQGPNSHEKINKKEAQADLNTATRVKEHVERRAAKVSGENVVLGNTLQLINLYFDRAEHSFTQTNFWQTHADALVVQVLAIEANALIK